MVLRFVLYMYQLTEAFPLSRLMFMFINCHVPEVDTYYCHFPRSPFCYNFVRFDWRRPHQLVKDAKKSQFICLLPSASPPFNRRGAAKENRFALILKRTFWKADDAKRRVRWKRRWKMESANRKFHHHNIHIFQIAYVDCEIYLSRCACVCFMVYAER